MKYPVLSGIVMNRNTMKKVIPLTLKQANEFVLLNHRHHMPVQGHRFSLGYEVFGKIVGVVVCGRPVARKTNFNSCLEVTRLCTDGTKNACSKLYSAAARVAKEMGFIKIQTFILESESGVSLKASGWDFAGYSAGGQWEHTDGKPRRKDQPVCRKLKYEKHFCKEQA